VGFIIKHTGNFWWNQFWDPRGGRNFDGMRKRFHFTKRLGSPIFLGGIMIGMGLVAKTFLRPVAV
jgi:hypothetical protein